MKSILKKAAALLMAAASLAFLQAPAATAASLCDGCPLQEICADTTAGVEVQSCENNAAATAPVPPTQMDMATSLINDEAAGAPGTSGVGLTTAADTAAVALAAAGGDHGAATAEISAADASFAGLTAYATSGEAGLLLTIKGEAAGTEALLAKFSEKFDVKNGAGKGCAVLVASSGEVTLKIEKGTEAEKIGFLESFGIKTEKQ